MSKYKDTTIITIHLGRNDAAARARKRALERLAGRAGYEWNGKPSVGRWLCAMADREIEKENKMYYKIDSDKLEKITELFNEQVDPKATEQLVEAEICADWHEGQEHQDWIVTASVQEIVDWLASFYE